MIMSITALVLQLAAARASVDVILAHHDESLGWLGSEPALTQAGVRVVVYHKGSSAMDTSAVPTVAALKLVSLTNVGRESHTYLTHIVNEYDNLADWTVFSQAGEPSFGYKGHRDGGGHLVAGKKFADYLDPTAEGARFIYTAAVQLEPQGSPRAFQHVLRSGYCINNASLSTGDTCPGNDEGWTRWWDVGWFQGYLEGKIKNQHGEQPLDFYRKYIDPSHEQRETLTLQFAQVRQPLPPHTSHSHQPFTGGLGGACCCDDLSYPNSRSPCPTRAYSDPWPSMTRALPPRSGRTLCSLTGQNSCEAERSLRGAPQDALARRRSVFGLLHGMDVGRPLPGPHAAVQSPPHRSRDLSRRGDDRPPAALRHWLQGTSNEHKWWREWRYQ